MLDLLVRYRKYSLLGLVVVAAVALLTASRPAPGGALARRGHCRRHGPGADAFARAHRGAASVWISYLDWKHLRADWRGCGPRPSPSGSASSARTASRPRTFGSGAPGPLRERLPERTLGAEVVARDWNGFTRGLTINRGAPAGPSASRPVIVTHGVVGRVAERRRDPRSSSS